MKKVVNTIIDVILTIISVAVILWSTLGDFFETPSITNPIILRVASYVLLTFLFAKRYFKLRKLVSNYQDQAPNLVISSINSKFLPFSYYYDKLNQSRTYSGGTASPIDLNYDSVFRNVFGSTEVLGNTTEFFLFLFLEVRNEHLSKGSTDTARNVAGSMNYYSENYVLLYEDIPCKMG